MISLTTAKLLLFVALCLGPHYGDSNHNIQIVNKNSYCVWTENSDGWTLVQKGFASADYPANGISVSTSDLNQFGAVNSQIARDISHHDWTQNSILYFENGDVAEKHGNKVFYTINAGSYNQQVYTILTLANGKPL